MSKQINYQGLDHLVSGPFKRRTFTENEITLFTNYFKKITNTVDYLKTHMDKDLQQLVNFIIILTNNTVYYWFHTKGDQYKELLNYANNFVNNDLSVYETSLLFIKDAQRLTFEQVIVIEKLNKEENANEQIFSYLQKINYDFGEQYLTQESMFDIHAFQSPNNQIGQIKNIHKFKIGKYNQISVIAKDYKKIDKFIQIMTNLITFEEPTCYNFAYEQVWLTIKQMMFEKLVKHYVNKLFMTDYFESLMWTITNVLKFNKKDNLKKAISDFILSNVTMKQLDEIVYNKNETMRSIINQFEDYMIDLIDEY